MKDLKELKNEELQTLLKELKQPAFRVKQIRKWMLQGAGSYGEMTNLPQALRDGLASRYSWNVLTVELVQCSASDGTRKYLLGLPDGNKVEAVFMAYDYGNSLCISTQVGCSMGCRFCASTIGGKIRDLSAWEIYYEYMTCMKDAGQPINHIVLMGMGEPFDNYEEVSAFLRLIHDEDGIGLSYRNITLSTCGLVPGIRQFGEEFPQVNLAISLHASTQEEREGLMPVAKAYGLDELMAACREHAEKTGRRVTFEYTLIEGRNDGEENADRLVKLLGGMLCHVNLISLNPVAETGMAGSSRKWAEKFRARLEVQGIPATVRRELGRDIDAACGQLRKKHSSQNIQ